jgi:spermidine synthase
MVLELLGSRMIAPYLGTSIIIWTAIIGVIMASMAAGYYTGGRIADARPSPKIPAAFIAVSALWVVLLAFAGRPVLQGISDGNLSNIYALAIGSALLLFASPCFLLAAVPPYAVRLVSVDNSNIGGTAGKVSAFSTAGGIAGTFLGGFVLISYFSVTAILLFTALALFVAAILVSVANWKTAVALVIAAGGAIAGLYQLQKAVIPQTTLETPYNTLRMVEYPEDGRTVRALITDNEKIQGRLYLDNPAEIAGAYPRFFDLAFYYKEPVQSILMLGGGVYVYPRYLEQQRPDISVDVVEIDPAITQVTRDFFYLADRKNQHIYHEDARLFVNRAAGGGAAKYDVVFNDAYGASIHMPFQLTTTGFTQNVQEILAEDGVFIVNFIGVLDSELFGGIYAALSAVFPRVLVFPVTSPDDAKEFQNIVLIALKNPESENGDDPDDFPLLAHEYRGKIRQAAAFTDTFAPVERYTIEMANALPNKQED